MFERKARSQPNLHNILLSRYSFLNIDIELAENQQSSRHRVCCPSVDNINIYIYI